MTAELRKLWRAYWAACDKAIEAGLSTPPFPDILRGLTCGAKTRAGTPCKQQGLYRSGRCKLHGGLSTGPTSDEGKKKVALNGNRGKAHER